jgi:hypothetical protein
MGLLDGGLAGVFAAALSPFYLDATLHRKNPASTDDGAGGGTNLPFLPGEAVKAQVDKTIQRTVEGVVDVFQSILVLQRVDVGGVSTQLARMNPDDEITAGGARWQIAVVETDPANAYFLLGGRRA